VRAISLSLACSTLVSDAAQADQVGEEADRGRRAAGERGLDEVRRATDAAGADARDRVDVLGYGSRRMQASTSACESRGSCGELARAALELGVTRDVPSASTALSLLRRAHAMSIRGRRRPGCSRPGL